MSRKTVFRRLLAVAALAIIAGAAALAQLRTGEYDSHKTETIAQTATPEMKAEGEYRAASYASAPPVLAEGDGRAETESFCALCHSTRYITMQPPLPAATWEAEVNKMVKTFGAPIPEASAKKITAYLQAHYAPENRTF